MGFSRLAIRVIRTEPVQNARRGSCLGRSAATGWLIVAPNTRLASTAALGDGEADALSLAKELGINDVLIDERRARLRSA